MQSQRHNENRTSADKTTVNRLSNCSSYKKRAFFSLLAWTILKFHCWNACLQMKTFQLHSCYQTSYSTVCEEVVCMKDKDKNRELKTLWWKYSGVRMFRLTWSQFEVVRKKRRPEPPEWEHLKTRNVNTPSEPLALKQYRNNSVTLQKCFDAGQSASCN